jgi:hypothetical protein
MALQAPVDYAAKDYRALRDAMFELATLRLPEWTDRSVADLGVLWVDLCAYVGDVLNYYQDRIAAESFLATAQERRSVIELLRLVGYELGAPIPATAELDLVFRPDAIVGDQVTIPRGTAFTTDRTDSPQPFSYVGPDQTVAVADLQPTADGKLRLSGLPVVHGSDRPRQVVGMGTGEPNLRVALPDAGVLPDTLTVWVGDDPHPWEHRTTLLFVMATEPGVPGGPSGLRVSSGEDRILSSERDADGGVSLIFGDGTFGAIPRGTIFASYRVGGGAGGNVPAHAITKLTSVLAPTPTVDNPGAAVGGAEAESTEHAARFGPLAFRSGDRAVTLSDYVTVAHQAGGVAKVVAQTRGWNRVDLYVAPAQDTLQPTDAALRQRLLAHFEPRRMVGTSIFVHDAEPVAIDVTATVLVAHTHDPGAVQVQAQAAVAGLLAFDRVDFGVDLYVSRVYDVLDGIDGVTATNVTRFRQQGGPPVVPFRKRLVRGQLVDTGLRPVHLLLLEGEIPPDGRVQIGDTQIAVPGTIAIDAREAPE